MQPVFAAIFRPSFLPLSFASARPFLHIIDMYSGLSETAQHETEYNDNNIAFLEDDLDGEANHGEVETDMEGIELSVAEQLQLQVLSPHDIQAAIGYCTNELAAIDLFLGAMSEKYNADLFLLLPLHKERIEDVLRNFCVLEGLMPDPLYDDTVRILLQRRETLWSLESSTVTPILLAQKRVPVHKGRNGAWTYDVPVETLLFYKAEGFSKAEMAQMIGVSDRTIQRRLTEHSIRLREATNVTDAELVNLLYTLKTSGLQNWGELGIDAALRSLQIRVSRERMRRAVRFVDPVGVIERWAGVIKRRVYSVPFPNSLWHIDGTFNGSDVDL